MMRKIAAISLVILFLFFSYAYSSIKIEIDEKAYFIDSYDKFNLTYVSITELNEPINGEIFWNELTKKGTWQIGDHQIVLTPFSPYIMVDTTVCNLVRQVELKKGTLFVPIETFEPILDRLVPQKISWNKTDKKLSFKKSKMNILDIKATEKLNGILLEIFMDHPLEYHIFLGEPRWLNISFFEGKLDTAFFSRKGVSNLIREIKAYQFDNSAQLSVKVGKDFHQYLAQMKSDPCCLQISLEDTTKTALAIESTFEKKSFEDNPIDVVIIDAGHGGEDLGAVGPSGLIEKNITLDITKKLAEYLEKDKDLKVVLTRDKDIVVPLEERSRIANRAGGDIFVSIHTNAAPRKTASGYETFFLAQSKSDEARAVATLENSSIRFEKPKGKQKDVNDLDFILLDMVQNEYLKESSELASIVQQELGKELKRTNRKVDQAEFVVLNKTYMPAVLVEVAFISNQQEEKLLKKDSFRKKIAEGLYNSIKEFKRKYETGKK